jgi:hypothetical protein
MPSPTKPSVFVFKVSGTLLVIAIFTGLPGCVLNNDGLKGPAIGAAVLAFAALGVGLVLSIWDGGLD